MLLREGRCIAKKSAYDATVIATQEVAFGEPCLRTSSTERNLLLAPLCRRQGEEGVDLAY